MVVSKENYNLLKWFDSQGIQYIKRHAGIYTVQGIGFLKMQVVVTEELDGETFRWLSVLTDRLTEARAKDFVGAAHDLTENEDKRLAESIVQVITSANERLFEKIKEDEAMASALFELMRPEAEKYAQECVKKCNIEHIKAMILHGDDNAYIKLIMNVSDGEIDELRRAMQ